MNLRGALALALQRAAPLRDLDILHQFCELVLHHRVAQHAWIGRPDAEGNFHTLALAGSRSILATLCGSLDADQSRDRSPLALVWHDQKPYYSPALPPIGAFADWYLQLRQVKLQSAAIGRCCFCCTGTPKPGPATVRCSWRASCATCATCWKTGTPSNAR